MSFDLSPFTKLTTLYELPSLNLLTYVSSDLFFISKPTVPSTPFHTPKITEPSY